MAISMKKGQRCTVRNNEESKVNSLIFAVGWDIRSDNGAEFDLDASAFMLGDNDKVRSDDDFIFYNQLESKCGSIKHRGDNQTGVGDGDDESIVINLNKIPSDVSKIAFTVSVNNARQRKQNFGMVENSYARILNGTTGEEILRYELGECEDGTTSVLFGNLYRKNGEWKFSALGQNYKYTLTEIARKLGVNV